MTKIKTMTLKTITSVILITMTFISCDSPAYISGKLEGVENNNAKVYLIKPENLSDIAASYFGKVIDSARVNANGDFEFQNSPRSKEPVLLELAVHLPGKAPNYLQADDPLESNYMLILYQPGEPVQITGKLDALQQSFSIVEPSEVNETLLHLRDIRELAYRTFLAGKHWDIEDASQLMAKEHAILHYQTKLIEFADSSQYLIPALVALRWVSPANDYERVPEFLVRQCAKWEKKQPDHPWVKQLCQESDPSNLPVLVGDVFPNIKLPGLTKDTISIKNNLGKRLTIIDLWASWCAPCRMENREVLIPIWNEYHDEGLQIIAYGLEIDESEWKSAAERDGANRWLQTSELQGDDPLFLRKIRVQTIPANFILDNAGVVLAKNLHGKALMDFVKNYMGKK